jgi:hypothetical protein
VDWGHCHLLYTYGDERVISADEHPCDMHTHHTVIVTIVQCLSEQFLSHELIDVCFAVELTEQTFCGMRCAFHKRLDLFEDRRLIVDIGASPHDIDSRLGSSMYFLRMIFMQESKSQTDCAVANWTSTSAALSSGDAQRDA